MASIGMVVAADSVLAQDAGPKGVLDEVGRLTDLWKEQRSKLVTMRAKGYKFVGGPIDRVNGPALGDAEVGVIVEKLRALLADQNAPESIEPLKALTSPLFKEKVAKGEVGMVGTWRPYTMTEESGTVRVDDGWMTTIRGPGGEIGYDTANKQVDIHPLKTGLVVETISTFLYRPNLEALANSRTLTKPRTGMAKITGPGFSLEYDAGSGAVSHYTAIDSRGRPAMERIQGGEPNSPQDMPVPIPKFVVEIRYDRGDQAKAKKISRLSMLVLTDVELNGAVADSAFDIVYPPGTTLVNYPGGDMPISEPKEQRRLPATRPRQAGVIHFPGAIQQPE